MELYDTYVQQDMDVSLPYLMFVLKVQNFIIAQQTDISCSFFAWYSSHILVHPLLLKDSVNLLSAEIYPRYGKSYISGVSNKEAATSGSTKLKVGCKGTDHTIDQI